MTPDVIGSVCKEAETNMENSIAGNNVHLSLSSVPPPLNQFNVEESVSETIDGSPRNRCISRVMAPFRIWLRIFLEYKERICSAFGSNFFWVIVAQYGLSQGASSSFTGFAANFFYKDIKGLDPASMQAYETLSHLPWDVKPIYGLLSDCVPILGLHRTYYIIAGGLFGFGGRLLLTCMGRLLPVGFAVSMFTFSNLSVALPDVMVDAIVAERSRERPELAADLQSLCWGSLTLCGFLGSLVKGPLLQAYGPEFLFGISALAPLLIMGMAWKGALNESKTQTETGPGFWTRVRTELRIFVGVLRIPEIMRPAAFIFLRIAVVPGLGSAMFFFYTDEAKFSPSFLGLISMVGSLCGLIAIVLYNRYFSQHSLRKILFVYGVVSFFSGIADLILVLRLNLALGIPDTVFVLGDDVLFTTLGTTLTMPINVLMAQLCPPSIEAMFFAGLASLNNSAYDVSEYLGAIIIQFFGITKEDRSALWKAIILKQFFKFIPIFLPLYLLPDRSPTDEHFLPSTVKDVVDGAVGRAKDYNTVSKMSEDEGELPTLPLSSRQVDDLIQQGRTGSPL